MTTRQLSVRLCADDDRAAYRFRCPLCSTIVVKDADPHVRDVLVASGVPLVVWRLPAELFEPRSGPPICHDDLLDFHHLLRRAGWFEALVRMTSPSSG